MNNITNVTLNDLLNDNKELLNANLSELEGFIDEVKAVSEQNRKSKGLKIRQFISKSLNSIVTLDI